MTQSEILSFHHQKGWAPLNLDPIQSDPSTTISSCKRPQGLTSHHHPDDVNHHRTGQKKKKEKNTNKQTQLILLMICFSKSIFGKQYKMRSESSSHNVGFGERKRRWYSHVYPGFFSFISIPLLENEKGVEGGNPTTHGLMNFGATILKSYVIFKESITLININLVSLKSKNEKKFNNIISLCKSTNPRNYF